VKQKESEFELNQLRLTAVLNEYASLKAELLQKFRHQLQMYSIVITAIVALIGYLLTTQSYDVLLVVPTVGAVFSLRYIWEQKLIALLGSYLRVLESDVFPELIGIRSSEAKVADYRRYWVGWEHYARERFPNARFYKVVIVLVFIAVPMGPALVYSAIAALRHYGVGSGEINTALPAPVHIAAFILIGYMAVHLSLRLWRS
jgi:hypothetical protein